MIIDTKLEHIENMTDKGIENMYAKKEEIKELDSRVKSLEITNAKITVCLDNNEKQMIDVKHSLINISDSQAELVSGMALIKQSIEADDGLRDMVKSNAASTKSVNDSIILMKESCIIHAEILKDVPNNTKFVQRSKGAINALVATGLVNIIGVAGLAYKVLKPAVTA